MHSQRELTALAAGKAALRRRIALQRAQCVTAAARIAQPLAWLDGALAQWRRLSPFYAAAAVPIAFLLKRSRPSGARALGALLAWGPIALGAVRSLSRARKRS